jgi:formylglycine-generating enzyme required for sulfatase activity
LRDHYGSDEVVLDVDTIPLGIDFRKYLNEQVSTCDILLAIIGDHWLEILNQRINDPKDFVRIEIQAALDRDIPVVPILVGNKPVPTDNDLPPELEGLAYRHATKVRAGPDMESHLKRLIKGLDWLLSMGKSKEQPEEVSKPTREKTIKNSIGMEFVLISKDSFKMGSGLSPEEVVRRYGGKIEWFKYEHPRHDVTIGSPFYLQTTPVTQGQWEKVMGNNPSEFKKGGDDCPVELVSWDDAHEFIQKLNETEDVSYYRLPTEAEWEYACRAGTTTDFSFGDEKGKLGDYAWYKDNANDQTHPVATKKPNPWGLFDMHGNVWEWVEDDYDGAPDDGSAWIDNPRSDHRVIRGGSWYDGARFCRSAYRSGNSPGHRSFNLGFRLSRSITLGT